MEEEDSPFPALSHPSEPFFRLNLQAIQAPKAKSNPNQAYSKCNYNSSSSITQIFFA
jgi:hypothetical protein